MSLLPETAHECSFGERVVGLAPSTLNELQPKLGTFIALQAADLLKALSHNIFINISCSNSNQP
jgi:hypothetical protein